MNERAPRPFNLIAELTYRCPLRCAYCSNPVNYAEVREALDAEAWSLVFRDAAALGALHVGLTGGEPTLHPELLDIVVGAAQAALYPHLVTAGTTLDRDGLGTLRKAGLRSVQLSIQDSRAQGSDAVAGVASFDRKIAFAADVRALDLPLILNVPLHRGNLERIDELVALAVQLGAHRLELANTQYHGWALVNRDALLPSRVQLARATAEVAAARRRFEELEILFVLPDYYADRPKPCMGGWAQKNIVVTPNGRVLPCHAAAEIQGLEFWKVPDRSLAECWADAPGMNAFRGEAWMPEPCRSCPERGRDFGGCRCQAYALTNDPSAVDPACELAPDHDIVLSARRAAEGSSAPGYVYRGPNATPSGSVGH